MAVKTASGPVVSPLRPTHVFVIVMLPMVSAGWAVLVTVHVLLSPAANVIEPSVPQSPEMASIYPFGPPVSLTV